MSAISDRHYRTAVLPFAGLMILGSAIILAGVAFSELPITYCPFVRDPRIQRVVVGAVAAVQALFGVGLARKSRAALYGLWTYLVVGTVFTVIASILDPPAHSSELERGVLALFAILVGGLIGAYLYSVRLAFT